MTIAERIQFILDFEKTDLDTLAPREWSRMCRDTMRFLDIDPSPGPFFLTPTLVCSLYITDLSNKTTLKDGTEVDVVHIPSLYRQLSPDDVRLLYPFARDFVLQLRLEKELHDGRPVEASFRWIPLTGGSFNVSPMTARTRYSVLRIRGTLEAVFTMLLLLIGTLGSIDKVSFCPNCDTLFVRRGKQKFCTARCTQQAAERTYRRTRKGKAARKRAVAKWATRRAKKS